MRLFAGPSGLTHARVTLVLLVVNALVFVGELAAAHATTIRPRVLLAFGAMYTPFIVGEGRVETLVTCCFLHVSLMHVAFNLFALREVGPLVEDRVGAARFASMYVVSGIAGSIASTAWDVLAAQARAGAGASGAICGAIGSAMVLGVRTQGWRSPVMRQMGIWLALTVILGVFVHADNVAHLAGAATGAAFAMGWRRGILYSKLRHRLTLGACAAIVLASGAAVAVRAATDPWAALDAGDRIDLAKELLHTGSCADAIRATARAEQLTPRAPEVVALKHALVQGCGR
jgi:rhomboid protease GluP